jgi:hypothetical protein
MDVLLGTILGAALGFFGSFWIWRLERLRQRRIAKMQIAINIRHWMTVTFYQFQELQTYLGSDGSGGSISTTLPDFRFEQSLEQVASVEDTMAVRIFKLIRKKDDANAEVDTIARYMDDDLAVETFQGRYAQIWLRALEIYDAVTEHVGWLDPAFSDDQKKRMRAEAQQFEVNEQTRGNSKPPIFS